jgi:nucleoside 2-deoxyribosyltransferase
MSDSTKKRPLKIYVAGGWKFRNQIKEVMELLDEYKEGGNPVSDHRPFKVISGWITRENGDSSPQALANDAYFDFKEIQESDVVFAIMNDPDYSYRGTFTEIGYAIGIKRTVIVWCNGKIRSQSTVTNETTGEVEKVEVNYTHHCMTNVFFHHPEIIQVDSLVKGIQELKKVKPGDRAA